MTFTWIRCSEKYKNIVGFHFYLDMMWHLIIFINQRDKKDNIKGSSPREFSRHVLYLSNLFGTTTILRLHNSFTFLHFCKEQTFFQTFSKPNLLNCHVFQMYVRIKLQFKRLS
jgi:hypothetical protein